MNNSGNSKEYKAMQFGKCIL